MLGLAVWATPDVHRSIAKSLIVCGSPAVPGLIKSLKDPSADARWYAVYALHGIGKPAKEALPALRRLQKDPDEGVRDLAAQAIAQIEAKSPRS
jgi:HEAT repeat protein